MSNKIFLSWSGASANRAVRALKSLLEAVLDGSDVFLSDQSIPLGASWRDSIESALNDATAAVICLTPESRGSAWVMFEAGWLSSRVEKVSVLLVGLGPTSVGGPLENRQACVTDKESTKQIVRQLNREISPRVPERTLDDRFELAWPRFEIAVKEVIAELPSGWLLGGESPIRGLTPDVKPAQYNVLHGSARHKLDIMGHTLERVLSLGLRHVLQALSQGAVVRLLYLHPGSAQARQLVIDTGRFSDKIDRSLKVARSIRQDLRARIEKELKVQLSPQAAQECALRFLPAVTPIDASVYHLIQRSDDTMLVSHYSQIGETGNRAPIEELRSTDPWFSNYEEEFENMWLRATPVEAQQTDSESERWRIWNYPTEVDALENWHRTPASNVLPPPRSLILLPHRGCNQNCPSCYTHQSGLDAQVSMTPTTFEALLTAAVRWNVPWVELSGGGEPLAHPQAVQLLESLTRYLDRGELRAGVLTNGVALMAGTQKRDAQRARRLRQLLLRLSYVRLSFREGIRSEPDVASLVDLARTLVNERRKAGSETSIGIKFLLTEGNKNDIFGWVEQFHGAGVDHIKVKSVRSQDARHVPKRETVRELEHKLCYLRDALKMKDLRIDLRSAKAGSGFACRLSPLVAVVDADGETPLCCNFYEARGTMSLGNVGVGPNANLPPPHWGTTRHRDILANIQVQRVCNTALGADCRLLNYQALVDNVDDRAAMNCRRVDALQNLPGGI